MKFLLSSGLIVGLLLGLTSPSSSPYPAISLKIMTWNVANFSAAKRVDQARAIKFLFQTYSLDILALQEVTHSANNKPLEQVIMPALATIGSFSFCASELGGGDKLAFVFNTATVSLECDEVPEVALVGLQMGDNRPALIARVNMAREFPMSFDFLLINIHPRATDCQATAPCGGRSIPAEEIRHEQFKKLAQFVWEYINQTSDWDIVLAGDFNELADTGINQDEGRLNLIEIFFEFGSTFEPTTVSGSAPLDYIATSKISEGATSELLSVPQVLRLFEDSAFCAQIGICTAAEFDARLSDHLPVLSEFLNTDSD